MTSERLLANVTPEPNTGCWLWLGGYNRDGYGQAWWRGGKKILAHRAAWEAANGSTPGVLRVLHRCDQPACINPDHLFLGTQADNVRDMDRKGRARRPSGERVGNAKLTAAAVQEIRAAAETGADPRDLAAQHGVVPGAIYNVLAGRNWRSA